ncbi:UvrD-helicase domain-containing protein [Candidatus Poriferisocius sp.]|uniref:UvrD-helicase domain-containing protein n=1 Tax=Candidatus Poriferisocius sp. TaxID=3101276 RepID=UPI003B02119C
MCSLPVVAESTPFFRLLAVGRRRAVFSDGVLRVEGRRHTLVESAALESLDGVEVRRGRFASRLTVREVGGAAVAVRGLDRDEASRLCDAVAEAARKAAAAVGRELVEVDEALRQLLRLDIYVRHSAMGAVHQKLVSSVGRSGGIVACHLSEPAIESRRRLEPLVPEESIEALRDKANQRFVSQRVPDVAEAARAAFGARLTGEQAEAIATDEDVTLVLAGAGTGKTTVMAAKVAHLVRNEGVDPDQILVLAYNNSAQAEIAGRLPDELSEVDIKTFHAFGRGVLIESGDTPNLSKMATDDHVRRSAIDDILEALIEDEGSSDAVVSFLLYHHEPCYSPFDFATEQEYEAYWRRIELRTLSGDLVKSIQELQIANFLSEHGVKFEYESKYPHLSGTDEHRPYLPDFYLPEHGIYIEHFALDEQGNPPPHFGGYAEGVAWKRQTHRQHSTTLIETYSWEHKHGTWRSSLRAQLESNGVDLAPVPRRDLIDSLSETRISRLSGLLATFLNHAKTSNASSEVLRARASDRRDQRRSAAFLDVFEQVRRQYDRLLSEAGEMDFHDFINRAAACIRQDRERWRYRYVLVDEFQDISAGRMNLLQALAFSGQGAACFLVGDDWQSIYRFAGSDVALVRGCGSHLGHVQQRALSRTFRHSDGILAPSTAFIKQNPEQTQRPMRSQSAAADDGITVVAADNPAGGVQAALQDIERKRGAGPSDVLVLGRYNTSRETAPPGAGFSTVHRAKGTEADYTVVVDLKDGRRGFPSQIGDDPLLELLLPPASDNPFAFAEERRLFYVALTRARNGAYLVTDPAFPSPFVLELLDRNPGLRTIGELAPARNCPRCPGGRLVRSQTHKTLRCTMHPHCDYQAPRCRHCEDGYVVSGKRSPAACTNPGCGEQPESCPWCRVGVIVPRQSEKTGEFEGCSEFWSKIGCAYTRDFDRRSSRR